MSDALRPGGTPHQETSPKNAAKLSFPSAGTPSAGPPQIGAAPAAAWREGTVGADRPRSRPSNQGPGGSPWPFQKHRPHGVAGASRGLQVAAQGLQAAARVAAPPGSLGNSGQSLRLADIAEGQFFLFLAEDAL